MSTNQNETMTPIGRAFAVAFAPVLIVAFLAASSARAAPMRQDGPGCKDKSVAATLVGLKDTDPGYIEIWANGMIDRSCRGYPIGEDVTVESRADGMVCIRAQGDDACFWVRESMAPAP